jgi:hypothetical protein
MLYRRCVVTTNFLYRPYRPSCAAHEPGALAGRRPRLISDRLAAWTVRNSPRRIVSAASEMSRRASARRG